MIKLKTKLTMSYLLIGLLCLLMMAFLANILLERFFIQYVMDNQTLKNQELADQVSNYVDNHQAWDLSLVEQAGINALEEGLILKVTDASGLVIWDATTYNSGMCEAMMSHMASTMSQRVPDWEGGMLETVYPINKNGTFNGTVQVGYYGPYYYTDADAAFIETINLALLLASVFAVIMAVFIGAIMAGRISRPIANVVMKTHEISEGNYEARFDKNSNTKEIDELMHAISSLAQRLENQEGLRRRLTSDVAHELRTPLATLQSHMEAMIDGIWVADEKRLGSCHEEILRLSDLVSDLERLAEIEREPKTSDYEPFSINDVVKQQLAQFEPKFLEKQMSIKFEENGQASIRGNKRQIAQVVVNLLSNAFKFSKTASTVDVVITHEGAMVRVSVTDHGIGISEEDLPHIFERFYRVDPSRNRSSGGAGIGLTISEAIVKAHGGMLTVSSTVGVGSTFTIILPKLDRI